MKIAVNLDRLSSELEDLASFSDAPPSDDGTAVTRVVFTSTDLEARTFLETLAEKAGLSLRRDAVGNLFFRWEGSDPSLAPIGTGSHTDAIPHAGMYDGTVGVLGGLEAIRALKETGFQPKRSIELLMFTSEEPTRFGIGCLGSRLLSGTLAPEKADAFIDKHERTLAEVRTAAGFSGGLDTVKLPAGYYSHWLELHIEQGPLLEREGLPIGIVTAIAAPASYKFHLEGFGGHAGALLMPDRKDALCAAAELILSVERNTLATGAIDTVGTVGTAQIHPGAVNSVPSRVTLELDLRDIDPVRRESVIEAVRRDVAAIQAKRGVTIREELVNADPPATSDAMIVATLEEVCRDAKIPYKKMVSRAYHDSLFMARISPIAMIFIPCRNGVSHRPDEYASPEAIGAGVSVLAAAMARLAAQ
ncbi:M20 family metallo-hydrolase [Terriglobus albidus]|uniref:M20 family metallo-hydrolase n=1 Tax=Terriglobus albidus TaxID=1592106 RepID=UPI0021DF7234|nr:M20 family metallo-hydrolase [Terriglobus albidus]